MATLNQNMKTIVVPNVNKVLYGPQGQPIRLRVTSPVHCEEHWFWTEEEAYDLRDAMLQNGSGHVTIAGAPMRVAVEAN